MPKSKKRSSKKPVELTPYERLQKAIEDGKILGRPIHEGNSEDGREHKLSASRSLPPSGYVQIGLAQGVTFTEKESRTSNWHRIDYWIVANVDPRHLEETRELLDDYLVEQLATKYNDIMDSNE